MSTPTKTNGTLIDFGALNPTTPQVVVGAAYYDALSGGNLICAGTIPTARTVYSGDSFNTPIGALSITLVGASGGVIGNAKALTLLDVLLGNGTPATVYEALMTAMPTGAGGGTEFATSTAYARVGKTNNSMNFPAASLV